MSESDTHAQARLVAGRYRLGRELGRGGMGTVWLADDELVGRQVAVKELRPPRGLPDADRDIYTRRALQEARSAARIHHANAVTLFDVLPPAPGDDAVYLIMELVGGPTLAAVIVRDGPQPAPAVAAWGLQLLDVLETAHGLGVVHRDIKPGNILITPAGQAKLTDFGIAHTVGEARLTRSGVMGTQAYMAPELFNSQPITPAADLWSLGATLFHAADGRGPFDRDTTGATLRAILLDDLPVLHCDPALAAAITSLLQRDPQQRATIDQARDRLREAAAQAPPPEAPAPEAPAPEPPGVPAPNQHLPWNPDGTTRSRHDHAAPKSVVADARRGRRRPTLLIGGIVLATCVLAAGVAFAAQNMGRAPQALPGNAGRTASAEVRASAGAASSPRGKAALSPTASSPGGKAAPSPTRPPLTRPPITNSTPGSTPGAPRGFTAAAFEHGAHLSWSPPANAGSAPVTYNLSWNGGSETVTGASASVGGLTNGQSYTFTLTAVNSTGTGPPVSVTADLRYPAMQFNAFDDQQGSVFLEAAPAPSAHIGSIPQGSSQPLTVICQTVGVSVSDPFQTWKNTSIWDEVQWGSGIGYVLDLYVNTPRSAGHGSTPAQTPPGGIFSDPPLWRCS